MAEQPFLPFDAPEERPAEAAPSGARLIDSLAAVCRERPLEEKILVSPSLAVGHTVVERLAREGHAWMNLRVETIRTLALALVGPDLAKEGLRLVSRAQALAHIEQACGESLSPDSYFGNLRDRPGFHRALQRTFDELRAAGISPESLPAGAFADRRKRDELGRTFSRYVAALAAGHSVDRAEVLRRAVAASGSRRADGPVYLLPQGLELSAVERSLLGNLAGARLVHLPVEPASEWEVVAKRASLFRATGEENEIREIFRRVLVAGVAFDDVEIVHTDASTYPSLVWELSREHGIPCTFSGGVAVTFTRPGQAALAFLDWIAQGFAAEILRQALSSGNLTLSRLPGADEKSPGARAAGRALREARIGWGASRHRTCVARLVSELENPDEHRREDDDAGEEERAQRQRRRQRRLAAARRAGAFVDRALELSACATGETCDLRALSRGCREFVTELARVSDEIDASALTGLQTLLEELEMLAPSALPPAEAAARIADAVRRLSVESDRARPGRLHVADVASGGFSGRKHCFLVGLDEARHPGADLEDPVLLDSERRTINRVLAPAALALYRDRPRDATRALSACVARSNGAITASYSSWKLRSLDQQSEQFPSPFFLDLYRASSGKRDADYTALLASLPGVAGFAPGEEAALDETEWWLSALARTGSAGTEAAEVAALNPHLADGARAEAARQSDEFTVYDGWIRAGTPELDPRESAEPQSASRLQTLASCPFRYFVRHVLGVEPVDVRERDRTRWLDPLAAGSLLHDVFRLFFERITARGEKPEAARHAALLEEIAEGEIRTWREKVPPRSELSFRERREDLLFTCRVFLRLEEEHCRELSPKFFEVPFGLPRADPRGPIASREPVSISAGGGKSFRLRGSIDRVDQAPDGSYHVWDYKTGGAFGYQEGRGVRGGRQIQFALYALALEALLDRAGIPAAVSRSGYFFPGRRGEGQRLRMDLDPALTRDVLTRLMDLLRAGAFPHATDEEDCRFCENSAVCGGAAAAAARSKPKLEKTTLPVLVAFREIHVEE